MSPTLVRTVVGPSGPIGPRGPAGIDGVAGPSGLPGQKGMQGAAGAKGECGLSGCKGATGSRGTRGDDMESAVFSCTNFAHRSHAQRSFMKPGVCVRNGPYLVTDENDPLHVVPCGSVVGGSLNTLHYIVGSATMGLVNCPTMLEGTPERRIRFVLRRARPVSTAGEGIVELGHFIINADQLVQKVCVKTTCPLTSD